MNLAKLQPIESDIDQGSAFWQNHVDVFNAMDITKREYSQQNNLGYHRFLYWHQKLSRTQLLPVKISSSGPIVSLCTVETPRGYRVMVHEASALTKILSLL